MRMFMKETHRKQRRIEEEIHSRQNSKNLVQNKKAINRSHILLPEKPNHSPNKTIERLKVQNGKVFIGGRILNINDQTSSAESRILKSRYASSLNHNFLKIFLTK
jgi:hypothetical protein